ncbi:hypothetical protein MMC28_002188 [Mycoblastus sanguinarius]|nr:hypothetical protein [Mycoblastus sanguinarius]
MSTRPTFIDLRSRSNETMYPSSSLPRAHPFPSPRMQHLAGDIPPAMSPLDMFAAQSRLLAKQLDDSKRNGRRVSRLPPLTTGDSITKQKSIYNRSRSAETKEVMDPGSSPRARDEDLSGTMPEVEEPAFRPKSFYPRMSNVPPEVDDFSEDLIGPSPEDQAFMTPAEFQSPKPNDYFGAPRAKSPEPVASAGRSTETIDPNPWVFPPRNYEAVHQNMEPQRGMSIESTSSRGYNGSLAPPMSPHVRQAGSIRSIPQDSSDDELSASTGGSGFSLTRKLSSSSGVSTQQTPFSQSPFIQSHGRSPSLNSEYSIGGSRQARQTFNFSRPLSRGSRPSVDVASRQPSFDSRPSMDSVRPPFCSASRQPSSDSQRIVFADDTVQTPMNVDSEHSPDLKENPDAPAPSYIYAKYSLPRGRMLHGDSRALENNQLPVFEWDRPVVQTNLRPTTPLANKPLSPTPSPQRSRKPSTELQRSSSRSSTDQRPHISPTPLIEQIPKTSPRHSAEQKSRETVWPTAELFSKPSSQPSFEQSSRESPRPSADQISRDSPRPSTDLARQAQNRPPPTPVQNDSKSEYSASTRSGSTIKARSRVPALSLELTAEDHLAKGIELHERGEARESTYHLRIAARQNLPTAMLLYALACRHGWGMRPNQQEGVQWLRKAADCAQVEIAVDEDTNTDVAERKTKRAQFALSIYELGVSHMNGWGIEQDKTLALRCFEIAANWGDADAMAEAGFCYAQGQGCKKDLKKAARYYRMAEAKGMSMVGNSWIYKPKYADDGSSNKERQGRGAKQTTPEKKPRDKSRTRTIFGRKKSVSQSQRP